jgi:hypothetical protein
MNPELPSEDEWIAAGHAGEQAVKDVVCATMLDHMTDRHHPATYLAVAFGAVAAVANAARACGASSGHAVLEEYLVAYVRGAMRGADGPAHEDGRPYEGTTNA